MRCPEPQVGILNAIPVSLFALIAVPGSLLIARVGAVKALVVGLLIAAVGSALRGFAIDAMTLFAATALMAAGVAVMQPALPPLVRQWVPRRIGFATAVYTNGLLCGEIFPVVLAAVIVPLLGGGWRASLEVWSRRVGGDRADHLRCAAERRGCRGPASPLDAGLARSPAMEGRSRRGREQPTLFLHQRIPARPAAANRPYRVDPAGAVGAQCRAIAGIVPPADCRKPPGAAKMAAHPVPVFLACLGTMGVATTTNLWGIVCAAALVGFTCAIGLTLVLTLPALLVAPDDVPRMSAGIFTIGYGIAMLISIISGMVWDITGNAAFAFVPIGLAILPMIVIPLAIDLRAQRS